MQDFEFNKILKEHYSGLKRVAASYESNLTIQEELVQEILESIWKSLQAYRGESSIKTYIYKIAHFRGAKHVQKEIKHKRAVQSGLGENEVVKQPETKFEEHNRMEKLMESIRTLPVLQRQLITMYLEGFSYAEISEITGVSMNHVGVTLSRVKSKLKLVLVQA